MLLHTLPRMDADWTGELYPEIFGCILRYFVHFTNFRISTLQKHNSRLSSLPTMQLIPTQLLRAFDVLSDLIVEAHGLMLNYAG